MTTHDNHDNHSYSYSHLKRKKKKEGRKEGEGRRAKGVERVVMVVMGCHPTTRVCTDASPTMRHHWMKESEPWITRCTRPSRWQAF